MSRIRSFAASSAFSGPPNRTTPTTIAMTIGAIAISESLPYPPVFIVDHPERITIVLRLLLRCEIAAPALDGRPILARLDLNGPPGAVARGVRRGVADDVAAAYPLDHPRVVVPEPGDVLGKIGEAARLGGEPLQQRPVHAR